MWKKSGTVKRSNGNREQNYMSIMRNASNLPRHLKSRLTNELEWEGIKESVKNQESNHENKMKKVYDILSRHGPVNHAKLINDLRKEEYKGLNVDNFVNKYLRKNGTLKTRRLLNSTLKQRVEKRKLNDLPTRVKDIEDRLSRLESILQRGKI